MAPRVVYTGKNVIIAYEESKTGIAAIAQDAPLALAVREVVVSRALPYAESISPVRTGDYARSFEVYDTHTVIAGMRRVSALLLNVSDHAAAVEFGNVRIQAHHVLGRTLDHLNGDALHDVHGPLTRAQARARGRR